MKVTVTIRDREPVEVPTPRPGVEVLEVQAECPSCCAVPLLVSGAGIARDDRSYRAIAVCRGCGEKVGTIEAKPDTVFGLEEDERVLNGPWRVY